MATTQAKYPLCAFRVDPSSLASPRITGIPEFNRVSSRAGTVLARWSASGFRCRAVPEPRPLSQIRDNTVIPVAR
jgi:hypothetical protein